MLHYMFLVLVRKPLVASSLRSLSVEVSCGLHVNAEVGMIFCLQRRGGTSWRLGSKSLFYIITTVTL